MLERAVDAPMRSKASRGMAGGARALPGKLIKAPTQAEVPPTTALNAYLLHGLGAGQVYIGGGCGAQQGGVHLVALARQSVSWRLLEQLPAWVSRTSRDTHVAGAYGAARG